MQSSVMIERNGAGIIVAYIRSMMWLPRIFTSMKCCSWRRNASRSWSNVVNAAGSPVVGPICRSVRGSYPLFSVISMTLGTLK
jgi:hypothetical protein